MCYLDCKVASIHTFYTNTNTKLPVSYPDAVFLTCQTDGLSLSAEQKH